MLHNFVVSAFVVKYIFLLMEAMFHYLKYEHLEIIFFLGVG